MGLLGLLGRRPAETGVPQVAGLAVGGVGACSVRLHGLYQPGRLCVYVCLAFCPLGLGQLVGQLRITHSDWWPRCLREFWTHPTGSKLVPLAGYGAQCAYEVALSRLESVWTL